VVLESLARVGLDDAELLRERYPVPEAPLLARVVPDARWGVRVGQGTDEAVLRQALLLGLQVGLSSARSANGKPRHSHRCSSPK
jgi:hypothetical protein